MKERGMSNRYDAEDKVISRVLLDLFGLRTKHPLMLLADDAERESEVFVHFNDLLESEHWEFFFGLIARCETPRHNRSIIFLNEMKGIEHSFEIFFIGDNGLHLSFGSVLIDELEEKLRACADFS